MKNKYQRMSKDEKKACKRSYYNTQKGKEMNIRLTRLTLTGIIGLMFSAFIILNAKKNNILNWTDWVTVIVLCISSVTFLVSSVVLRQKNLNKYAIKNNSNNINK